MQSPHQVAFTHRLPALGKEGSGSCHQFCTWLPALGWPGMSCSPLGLCATLGSGALAGLPRFPSFQAAWGCPWRWPCCRSSPPSSGSGLGSGAGCSSRSTRVPETTAVREKRFCLGSLQLPAMHPYSGSPSRNQAAPPTTVRWYVLNCPAAGQAQLWSQAHT